MSALTRFWRRSGRILVRYGCQVVFLVAILLLGLSYLRPDYGARLRRQKNRVERALHKREQIAERINSILLHNLRNNIRFCRICGASLPLRS